MGVLAKNQLRRESVILRKASVKTAATKDELENLMRKDAFLIAAAKALGVWEPEHEEWLLREGYEQYFVPPQKKASDVKIWDEKNTPPKIPSTKTIQFLSGFATRVMRSMLHTLIL